MIPARVKATLFSAAAATGAAVLYQFPPVEHSLYPRCPFYLLTRHQCPGCGATRALFELLHGRFAAALQFNPVVTLVAPVALGYFALVCWTAFCRNRLEWPEPPRWAWKAALASVFLLGLARGFFEQVL